jgi:NAD(P)-dependent dehydrogenase (short-subunit alcohol dehydrogenase family)
MLIVASASPPSASFAERRVFVSGGAKGIGAAIARRFANAGASVVIGDLYAEAGAAIAAKIGARSIVLDVADAGVVAEVLLREGPFDTLVNNAGIDQHAFFTDTNFNDWRKLIAANLESVLACTHAVLPAMQKARFGRIINVASEAARLGSRGGAVYAAAKAGVIAFTKSIARENARYGITANAIAPGPIRTPMLEQAIATGGDALMDAMVGATLLRRLGEPDEVAATALFLASHDASYITGETIGVSGGMGLGG